MSKFVLMGIVGVIVAVNAFALYRAGNSTEVLMDTVPPATALSPAVNRVSSTPASEEVPIDLKWPSIQKTKLISLAQDSRVEFSAELQAAENKLVRVSGVLFFIKDGIRDGKVQWCVLMPPSRYACCGISCDPRQELMFFVDCSKMPWPRPDTKILAVVQGRLRLRHDDSSWCFYTLENAEVTLMPGEQK